MIPETFNIEHSTPKTQRLIKHAPADCQSATQQTKLSALQARGALMQL